ncbi:MAG: efflux RND transporter periplasmic adaptor subunit [Pirellulaceae bacterium]
MKPKTTFRTGKGLRAKLVGLFCLFGIVVWAHEGHAPLPSKGVEVDIKKGTILLTKSARDALGLKTAVVQKRPQEERLLAYASIVAPWAQRAFVSSQVTGKVTKLLVQPGQLVAEGETLAELESSELENLQHELLQAKIAFELSQKLLDHYRSLAAESVIGRQVQDAAAKHATNQYSLEIARAKLKNIGLADADIQRLETNGETEFSKFLTIKSPIAGRAHHIALSLGKVIQPREHLFEVVDIAKVWCRIDILEKDVHRIAVGQTVEIRLSSRPDDVFKGKIAVTEQFLDSETHLGRAWVDLENANPQNPQLLPGMFGQAHIVIPGVESLNSVPASAVARDGAERFVLVQNEETAKASVFAKHNIVVVSQDAETVMFKSSSVFPEDVVVTIGAHELFNFFVQSVLTLSPEAYQNIGLKTAKVTSLRIDDLLNVQGQIELPPEGRDFVSVQLPGRIAKILVTRGAQVSAGDVLVELESLELQDLQVKLIASQIESQNLEVTIERLKKAITTQSVAQRQLWEAESELLTIRNQMENIHHRLEAAGLSEEQLAGVLNEKKLVTSLPIRATISGTVVGFEKALGQSVELGEKILELHDNSRHWIRGFVTEKEAGLVTIGQSARVRLLADPAFLGTAKVVRRDQSLDPTSRTLSFWLELDQKPSTQFHDNMLTNISLILQTAEPKLAIPQEALVKESNRRYVFVKQPNGRFSRRNVTTGRFDERFVEVTSGLYINEEVASWGAVELQSAYNSLR